MLAQQRAHEPSMEEILASIRRIISDDNRPDPAPRAEAPALAPSQPANVAPLSPSGVRSAQPFSEFARRAEPMIEWSRPLPPAPEPVRAAAPEPAPVETQPFDLGAAVATAARESREAEVAHSAAPVAPSQDAQPTLLSRESDAAVSAQFGVLADAMMANNAQRLEDMTRQMLRPMLKAWLDDNLPILVEKLVRAEIERVARGGR
jgi:hypothetical protein